MWWDMESQKKNKRDCDRIPALCAPNLATGDFCLDSRRRPASIYLFIEGMKNQDN